MKIETLAKNKSLSYLTGINRPIYPSQVTKLAESINDMGLIRPVVVAWISFLTGKLTPYIIDGQHLFNALIRNGLPIEYTVIEIKNKVELVKKIALLNASSKSWKMTDYVLAWSAISEDFKKLNHYYNVYDFELGVLASILSGKSLTPTHIGGHATKDIKNGSFKVVKEKETVQILDYLTDVLKVIPRMNRQENKYVCSEYVNFLRTSLGKYNHKLFMSNLTANKQKFVLATQQPEKLSEMFKKLSN